MFYIFGRSGTYFKIKSETLELRTLFTTFWNYFNLAPFIVFALLFLAPSYRVYWYSTINSRNSDPGHIAGSSPPLPTTFRALHSYREKISPLSSLVDSRRIVLMIPTIFIGALSSPSFLVFAKKKKKSHHGGIRTHELKDQHY